MNIHYSEPPEKYAFLAMFGALAALHTALLVHHIQLDGIPVSIIVGQTGFVVFVLACIVWLIRTPW